MRESDWKLFTELKDIAIEKYCTLALDESQKVISDQNEHSHNRYLLLYKLLQNRNKHMSLLFDGHSRSKAWIQLIFNFFQLFQLFSAFFSFFQLSSQGLPGNFTSAKCIGC